MAGRGTTSSEASSLKAKGNALYRDGRYVESLVEYTSAVELDKTNPILYSNRSLAFLKLGQHFYAMTDAEMAIRLNPEWTKGYYRKGQVEEAAEQYDLALDSYQRGLRVNPNDDGLKKAVADLGKKEAEASQQRRIRTKKYIVCFVSVTFLAIAVDMNLEQLGYLSQIVRWVLVSFAFMCGIFFAQSRASWHDARMKKLLIPPKDLLKELQKSSRFSSSTEARSEPFTQEGEGSEVPSKKDD